METSETQVFSVVRETSNSIINYLPLINRSFLFNFILKKVNLFVTLIIFEHFAHDNTNITVSRHDIAIIPFNVFLVFSIYRWII